MKKWLDEILENNERFLTGVNFEKMDTKRSPGTHAIVTCMDPRINLKAIGIDSINEKRKPSSQIRIIRTVGGVVEPRSIVVAKYLAGLKELTIMMHTDCGNSLVCKKIDVLLENMFNQLEPERLRRFRSFIGEPFRERLLDWLKAFEEPQEAVKREIQDLRNSFIVPKDLVMHGLVYDIFSGKITVVVNGYT